MRYLLNFGFSTVWGKHYPLADGGYQLYFGAGAKKLRVEAVLRGLGEEPLQDAYRVAYRSLPPEPGNLAFRSTTEAKQVFVEVVAAPEAPRLSVLGVYVGCGNHAWFPGVAVVGDDGRLQFQDHPSVRGSWSSFSRGGEGILFLASLGEGDPDLAFRIGGRVYLISAPPEPRVTVTTPAELLARLQNQELTAL